MNRALFLLLATVAVLPAGCVTLPVAETAPTAEVKTEAANSPELPPAQAANVCLKTAEELEKKDHDQEALLEYQLARKHNPKLPGVARHLAVLYGKLGDTEHARTEFQTALQEQPRDATLLNDLGYFHAQLGEYGIAEKHLQQAVALDPKNKRAWINYGKVLVYLGRYEQSCEAFGHVVRPAQAAANVGILLVKAGKTAEARPILHKALDLEPDLQAARAVLAHLDAGTMPEVRLTLE